MTKLNTFSKISCPVLSLFYIFSRICELCPFPNMPSVCQHQSAVIDSENPSSDHGVLQCDIIYWRPTDYFLFFLFCHALSYSMPPPPSFCQGGISHLDRCAKRPLAPVHLLLSCPASLKLNRFALPLSTYCTYTRWSQYWFWVEDIYCLLSGLSVCPQSS